jgi:PAS domain S-box-containing protein
VSNSSKYSCVVVCKCMKIESQAANLHSAGSYVNIPMSLQLHRHHLTYPDSLGQTGKRMKAVDDDSHMVDLFFKDQSVGKSADSTDTECCLAMLAATSTIAMLCQPENSFTDIINRLMNQLGRAVPADRVIFYRLSFEREKNIDPEQFFFWTRPDQVTGKGDPFPGRSTNSPKVMSNWLRNHHGAKPVIGRVESFPTEFRTLLGEDGAGWIAAFPIRVDGGLWGLLQLENSGDAMGWTGAQIKGLEQVCLTLGRNIEHRRNHASIRSELSRNKAQRQIILDEFPDMIRFVDPDLHIHWANYPIRRMLGAVSEEMTGRTCHDLIMGRETVCDECPTLEAKYSGKVVRREMQKKEALGYQNMSYWDVCSIPLKNEGGEIEGFVQISRDITEQKRTLIALKESEAALRAILESSPVGIGLIQKKRLVWGNRALGCLLGYTINESTGLSATDMEIDETQYMRVRRELFQARRKGNFHIETEWEQRDGHRIPIYLQARQLDISDPGQGTIIAVSDTTERKRAADHIHFLTRELIKAQETERARIARDLHDDLGQDLSSLKIASETLFKPGVPVPNGIRRRIEEFSNLLQHAIDSVRNMAYDLRPPELDELGLAHTVYRYCEDFKEKTGTQVDFFAAGMENLTLGHEIEINLYRIIQEAFNNIRRHSGARHVLVRLVASSPHIILRIEDDGAGFNLEDAMTSSPSNEKRMGLGSMRERVALMDGELKIESRLNRGTKVYARIPYHEVERVTGL